MGIKETNIVNSVILAVQDYSCVLFKNVRGLFYTLDVVEKLLAAFRAGGLKAALELVRSGRLRKVMAGLGMKGSGDLIGYRRIRITQDMVGIEIAQFVSMEVKTPGGLVSGPQQVFSNTVSAHGGVAGIVRSPEDAIKLLEKPIVVPK